MCAIQQEAEHVEAVVDVVQQVQLMAGGVLPHLRFLRLAIQLVEALLDLPEHGLELIHHRFYNRPKQTLLVPKAGVDGPGAGAGLLGDSPQGGVQKAPG